MPFTRSRPEMVQARARVRSGTGGQDPVVLPGYHAPPAKLFATELPRAGLDLAALVTTSPLLATARRGDGHPVLVLPGLLTGDPATMLLRGVLRALGHNVSGWTLDTNRGATSSNPGAQIESCAPVPARLTGSPPGTAPPPRR